MSGVVQFIASPTQPGDSVFPNPLMLQYCCCGEHKMQPMTSLYAPTAQTFVPPSPHQAAQVIQRPQPLELNLTRRDAHSSDCSRQMRATVDQDGRRRITITRSDRTRSPTRRWSPTHHRQRQRSPVQRRRSPPRPWRKPTGSITITRHEHSRDRSRSPLVGRGNSRSRSRTRSPKPREVSTDVVPQVPPPVCVEPVTPAPEVEEGEADVNVAPAEDEEEFPDLFEGPESS